MQLQQLEVPGRIRRLPTALVVLGASIVLLWAPWADDCAVTQAETTAGTATAARVDTRGAHGGGQWKEGEMDKVISLKLPWLLGAVLGMAGCFRVSVVMPRAVPGEKHSTWVNGFVLGLVGGTVDAARFCGGRPVARVDTKRSAGNMVLTWLTLGIYTPSKAWITCSAGYDTAAYVPPPAPAYELDRGRGYVPPPAPAR